MRLTRNSPEAKLERFYPVRYFLYRDDDRWLDASQHIHELRQQDPKWRLISADELVLRQMRESGQLPAFEVPGITPERVDKLTESTCGSVELAMSLWQRQGEQIFDLSPLSAMFQESDASDLPVAQLKLPYESFYVHWGKHLEMSSPAPSRFIEGCFVDSGKVKDGSLGINFWFVCSDAPSYHWDEHSLYANIITDVEGCLHLFDATDEKGTIGGILATFNDPTFGEEEEIEKWAPYAKAALNMAANCLCYLASPKSEISVQFPPQAPERLTRQLSSKRPTEVRRAKSKLDALGFRVIHLCGRDTAKNMGLAPGSRVMPTHWRRGHWKPVRFGKGWSNVRIDWIDATIVNADRGSPSSGHLYIP